MLVTMIVVMRGSGDVDDGEGASAANHSPASSGCVVDDAHILRTMVLMVTMASRCYS